MLATMLAWTLCAAACAGIEDVPGKRTRGTVVDDQQIARAVARVLKTTEGLAHANIDIAVFNYTVLLTGQAPTPEARVLAVDVASGVRKVAGVHDELVISGSAGWLSGVSDGWLSTKINSRLLLSDEIQASRVLVTVEGGVVYLMGLVTHAEADAVVGIVQRTRGIAKIVRLFEYVPERPGSDAAGHDGAASIDSSSAVGADAASGREDAKAPLGPPAVPAPPAPRPRR